MKELIKKAEQTLKEQRDYLLWLSNTDADPQDLEDEYNKSRGYAHAYEDLGLITGAEALAWVLRFSDACEGR